MIVVVGLGNPGPSYTRTRHNIGFWCVDHLRERWVGSPWKTVRYAPVEVAQATCDGCSVTLLKPTTYMNVSGRAVGAYLRYHRLAPDTLWVAHDELDLPVGDVRLKHAGGSAGHNGLKDITRCLQTDAYHRLRFGIGHPGDRGLVSSYVLSAPPAEERDQLHNAVQRVEACAAHWLQGAWDAAAACLRANG